MKNDLKKIFIIARYTFMEIYKSKIMMSIVFLGLALIVVSFVASEFSYGVPERIALDFGFGSLTLSSVGMAIFIGVNLIAKEIENRTVYMTLSRPVRRYSFLLGKILGLSCILWVNILLLGILSIGFFLYLGGEFTPLLLWMIFFAFLEALLAMLIVMLFSLVTNITMSVVYTLAIYIAGHAINDLSLLPYVKANPWLEETINLYSWLFPNFSKINIKDYAIYKQNLSLVYLSSAGAYALCYATMLLMLAGLIFQKKNLD